MNKLSVIIITKNEAQRITDCLQSVKWADEIIVLDSGSSDNTIALCQQFTDKIYEVDWPGYGIQKNRALEKAQYDWVLSIDADEILSQELQKEIQLLLQSSLSHSAYSIPRLSKYCHKYLYYGDWKNDQCIRLFKRTRATFKNVPVHEELMVDGSVGNLKSCLLHNSFQNLEQVLHKVNEYSSLGAKLHFETQKSASLSKAILHGLWTFFRSYVLKLGFLDGREGFIMAFSNAEGCYYRYLKLLYLRENKT